LAARGGVRALVASRRGTRAVSSAGERFPDTEEVTSSNLVRPTRFFEILPSAESQDGSQAPAVLRNKRWSRRWYSGLYTRRPGGFGQLEAHSADAIECGNHAASRTSRTVNAARHAHIADSVLEVCLGATPVHGVYIGDSGAKPLPARKGLTGLRLCVMGRNSEPATSTICPCTPDFGAARPGADHQGEMERSASMPAAGILAADGALFICRSISNDRSGAAPAGQRVRRMLLESAEDDRR
jgi:hypothetical protein